VSGTGARVQARVRRAADAQSTAPEPAPRSAATASETRIGVLGGTFDPPHVGHLWLATLAADALGLDRVLLMPAARPPHKRERPISNAADRVMMTRLAVTGDRLLDLSLIEMERPGPSYTVDSLEELRAAHGGSVSLVLILAADSLAEIDGWRQPDRLLELAEWAVGPRPGWPLPDRAALRARFGAAEARIHLLDGPSLDLSSSEIRRRVAAGRSIRYLVPRAVEELIADRGLYRRP
jgi:nicotinate-nucleotide adenylyltransferase